MTRSNTARRTVAALLTAGVSAVLMTAAPAHADSNDSCHPSGAMPRVGVFGNEFAPAPSDPLVRAQGWVGAGLACSPMGSFGGYRTDAGGYAAMAWHLTESMEPSELLSTGSVTPLAGRDDLAPGDGLLNPAGFGHVVVFDHWADDAHTSYLGYEFTATGVQHRTVPYPYFAGQGDFRPVRAAR
ncbi:hypothetical protein [Kitasatospora sp. CB02891]|uniref:hypothetical protein n=1 Tax=Kitasatospora sp. CB02891 TaxID=2020329 RepID=UPI000C26FC13|nr:hypothetical protein [Kitasatospora sp. CB02891]PJN23324.1 hypothetical protein CG736_24165 [Kitasatospora sp. CB02891]